MHLPKLLCYTCTAIAAGGMSAEAQNIPEGNDLRLDDREQSPIAGDNLNVDRVPENTEILAQQVATPPEVFAVKPETSAIANEYAVNSVAVAEIEPIPEMETTAASLGSNRITVTPEMQTPQIADASESTCVASATPEQIAQGFNNSNCPRPRRYTDVEFTEDYQTRSSPAMSIYIPVGYGADNNTVFFTGNYQSEVRVDPGSTFNGGLGIGLGDADDAVGVELSYAFANNPNFGEGGFNGKIHRRFPGDVSVAAGWNGFLNIGRHDWEHSLYGAITKVFRTQDSLDKLFSRVSVTAGVGSNQFRSNGARIVRDNNANVFGNVAVRVARPVSLIAEWTGQDLGLGLSIAPFANIPFVITPAVRDVVGNEFSPRFVLTSGMSYQF
ncbi:MAG: hypothetical protein ACLFT0_17275 [Spirulinaceae cyanobacterium]